MPYLARSQHASDSTVYIETDSCPSSSSRRLCISLSALNAPVLLIAWIVLQSQCLEKEWMSKLNAHLAPHHFEAHIHKPKGKILVLGACLHATR